MSIWSKNKKNKDGVLQKINKNLPMEAMPDFSHFEINSNQEVIVEGNKGIIHYDENIIKLNMGKMVVMFCGRNLSLNCLDVDSLVISGFITSIEFIT
ncbi:MAG: YabP/YqfC family sporulation protein [Clostridia bacterium]|nr:YabP/YqfC family sporulation protein [Clostridia bacterium]